MDLFNKYKNKDFDYITNIINLINKHGKIITEEETAHCFSGFVLKDGQRVKVVTNAYFPQTVKWWLEKKIKSYELGDIVVKRRNNSESPVIQMKRFKEELMQQKII